MKSIKIVFLAIASFILIGCGDFLDENPTNRASLSTPKDIEALLVSAYAEYNPVWFLELMSDNVTDVGIDAPADNVTVRQSYHWEAVDAENQNTPNGFWSGTYAAIAASNHALEAIAKLEADGVYSQDVLDHLKGEALICRAYNHFMLVNIFAEHYGPNASTTPGIPFVTTVETKPIEYYTRLSVKEVYDLIENDIKTAFPVVKSSADRILIRDENYTQPAWHFNRKAAATFASRFYLFRGETELDEYGENDWDKVIYYANYALEGTPATFLRDWAAAETESNDMFSTNYSKSDVKANFLIQSTMSTMARAWYHRYTMDIDLLRIRAVYGTVHPTSQDITFDTRVSADSIIEHGYLLSNKALGNTTFGCYFILKYAEVFKREGINADYGYAYVMYTPIVAEEALFNLAEAYVMKQNYAACNNLLNVYYSKRVKNYDPTAHTVGYTQIRAKYQGENSSVSTSIAPNVNPHYELANDMQKAYLRCLIAVRSSEFIGEGRRWFDIKRMHMEISHKIYPNSSMTLTPEDPRRVVPIPPEAEKYLTTSTSLNQPVNSVSHLLKPEKVIFINDSLLILE